MVSPASVNPAGMPRIPARGPRQPVRNVYRIMPGKTAVQLKFPGKDSIDGVPQQFLIKVLRPKTPVFYVYFKTLDAPIPKIDPKAPDAAQKAAQAAASVRKPTFIITQTKNPESPDESLDIFDENGARKLLSIELKDNDWVSIKPLNTDFDFGEVAPEEVNSSILQFFRQGTLFTIHNPSRHEVIVVIGDELPDEAKSEASAPKPVVVKPPEIKYERTPTPAANEQDAFSTATSSLMFKIVLEEICRKNTDVILTSLNASNMLKESKRKGTAIVEPDGTHEKRCAFMDPNGEIQGVGSEDSQSDEIKLAIKENKMFRVWVRVKLDRNASGPNFSLVFDPAVSVVQKLEDARRQTEAELNKRQNPYLG